ncbi:MAG: hypothetical protein RR557_08020 [Bacilli bacterium]
MESQKILTYSEKQIDDFKKNNEIILKNNINLELEKVQDTIPEDIWDKELAQKVEGEVSKKLLDLNNSIDINPTALYYSLKSDVSLNPETNEKELTLNAYKFLSEKTKNKYLKKILKEKIQKLRKEK